MKHAPEVSQGRMCRPSIAIRYSTCWSRVTRLVVFATSHFTEQRSAPEASTDATAMGVSGPGPRRVSASRRSAIVVVTSASARPATSRAGVRVVDPVAADPPALGLELVGETRP